MNEWVKYICTCVCMCVCVCVQRLVDLCSSHYAAWVAGFFMLCMCDLNKVKSWAEQRPMCKFLSYTLTELRKALTWAEAAGDINTIGNQNARVDFALAAQRNMIRQETRRRMRVEKIALYSKECNTGNGEGINSALIPHTRTNTSCPIRKSRNSMVQAHTHSLTLDSTTTKPPPTGVNMKGSVQGPVSSEGTAPLTGEEAKRRTVSRTTADAGSTADTGSAQVGGVRKDKRHQVHHETGTHTHTHTHVHTQLPCPVTRNLAGLMQSQKLVKSAVHSHTHTQQEPPMHYTHTHSHTHTQTHTQAHTMPSVPEGAVFGLRPVRGQPKRNAHTHMHATTKAQCEDSARVSCDASLPALNAEYPSPIPNRLPVRSPATTTYKVCVCVCVCVCTTVRTCFAVVYSYEVPQYTSAHHTVASH